MLLMLRVFILSLVLTLPFSQGHASGLLAQVDSGYLPTLAHIVEKAEDAVVNISASGRSQFQFNEFGPYSDFMKRFFKFNMPQFPRNRQNVGSGVIIDSENGYVLTNHHLLTGGGEVSVTLTDGRVMDADVVGTDTDMDIALLKIPPANLVEIELGDSDELRVGDFVLAMGSPFGLSATVTSGIVSALGRRGLGLDEYEDFIQTDAAINPGSSGGALINLRGELVGINTAILAPSGGSVGIGFAIPINTAASITRQLIEYGHIKRGILGIHFQELTPELAEAFNISPVQGVLVNRVVEGTAAEKIGMREGDILTHINDVEIRDGAHLRNLIALVRVGEEVHVQYRRDGQEFKASGFIASASPMNLAGETLDDRLQGAIFVTLEDESGVIVSELANDSVAWELGLRKDDVVVELNHQEVRTLDDLRKSVNRGEEGRLLMKIVRDGNPIYMVLG